MLGFNFYYSANVFFTEGRSAVGIDSATASAGSENQKGGDVSRNKKQHSDATKGNRPKSTDQFCILDIFFTACFIIHLF